MQRGIDIDGSSASESGYSVSISSDGNAIAIVAFTEAISISKGISEKNKFYELNPNQELLALGSANITVNKNAVPNDPQSPFITSGIRIGTPSITTRGFDESDAKQVANWCCDIMDNMGDDSVIKRVKGEVLELCKSRPLYEFNKDL